MVGLNLVSVNNNLTEITTNNANIRFIRILVVFVGDYHAFHSLFACEKV